MSAKHSIRFENDSLYFSASHFITFGEPEKVEALHGHNFRIRAELSGPMNRQAYIVDFVIASEALKKICESLTHKVLLARDHPYIKIRTENGSVRASMPPLRWEFPVYDTLILPIRNTTTEALAEYIALMFRKTLQNEGAFEHAPEQYSIRIELEEAPGMWAVYQH